MFKLNEKHCKACSGETPKLTKEQASEMLKEIPGWNFAEDGNSISKQFDFSGFMTTMGFVNAMAWVANTEKHHPDFQVSYNKCVITFTTHAINGLSENDFICAAKIEQLPKLEVIPSFKLKA
jgi:4a-hydroxytetrahydrobiopterin dehydratase